MLALDAAACVFVSQLAVSLVVYQAVSLTAVSLPVCLAVPRVDVQVGSLFLAVPLAVFQGVSVCVLPVSQLAVSLVVSLDEAVFLTAVSLPVSLAVPRVDVQVGSLFLAVPLAVYQAVSVFRSAVCLPVCLTVPQAGFQVVSLTLTVPPVLQLAVSLPDSLPLDIHPAAAAPEYPYSSCYKRDKPTPD